MRHALGRYSRGRCHHNSVRTRRSRNDPHRWSDIGLGWRHADHSQSRARHGGSPAHAGVKVYCNYDDTSVYLMVDVDDDLMVRTKGGGPEEDHVQLAFGIVSKAGELERIDRLRIWLRGGAKLPRIVKWKPKNPQSDPGEGPVGRLKPLKGPPVMEVYDAMQQRGYVVELKMPKKKDHSRVSRRCAAEVRGVCKRQRWQRQRTPSYAATSAVEKDAELSEIGFEEGHSAFTELLHDLKLSDGDVHFNKMPTSAKVRAKSSPPASTWRFWAKATAIKSWRRRAKTSPTCSLSS